MPAILGTLPSALIAAREGMSANQFYRELQSLGMGARRSEVLSIYKMAQSIIARSPDELFRDIGSKPAGHETTPWPTKNSSGILQTVSLVYRDRTTGTITRTYWSTKNETPMTRENAMAAAINAYSDHAEEYDQDLIGAIHTGAYVLTPFEGT